MNALLSLALGNAVAAAFLALIVFGISRVCRRPALIHALWMLVLIKLITPPVLTIPVDIPGLSRPVAADSPQVVLTPQSSAPTADNAASSAVRRSDFTATRPAESASDPTPPSHKPDHAIASTSIPSPAAGAENPETQIQVTPDEKVVVTLPPVAASGMPKMEPSRRPQPAGVAANAASEQRETDPADLTAVSTVPDLPTESLQAIQPKPDSMPVGNVADGGRDSRRAAKRGSIVPLLAAVWAAGSLFFLVLTAVRILMFRHLLRNAEPASAALQRQTEKLACEMGLSRAPQVLLLPGAVSPMLWAVGRTPWLLYPRDLLARTDERSRATLLMHELAHMRRGDHWVRFLELLAFALYWWNPVVWLARREIHRHEEECCDAWVVEHSPDGGHLYATALLDTIDFLSDNSRKATSTLCPPIVSGIGHVAFIRHRLTRIFRPTSGGRMSKRGRMAVVTLAVAVLPMLPILGEGRTEQSTRDPSAKQQASDEKGGTVLQTVRDGLESRPTARTVSPLDVGDREPTDFETSSRTLQFDPLEVRTLDVSPDGKLLATGHGRWTTTGMVRIWDLKTKKELASFPEDKGIASVQFSPDGKLLVTAGWAGTLRIRDAKTFKILHEIPLGSVARLAFSPDGKTLASATESQKLQFWDPQTGGEKKGLTGTFFRMQHVAYSPNGRYIAVGGGKFDNPQNGRVAVWDLKTGKQLKVIDNIRQPVIGVAFSPDSRTLVAGGFDRALRAWSVPDLKLSFTSQGHTQGIEGVRFSPKGKVVASTSYDRTVRLWDSRTGELLTVLGGHTADTYSLDFTSDGKRLFTGGADKVIRIWDTSTYRQVDVLEPGADAVEIPEAVLSVAYSPDGKFIATAHEDKTVRLREAESGKVVKTLRGHDDVVAHLAFSPDGKLLATASFDKTVKLWSVPDGRETRTLEGHTNWVFSVAFSPDGKTLASAGYDKTIRLWNVADGKPLGDPLSGHAATVRSVAFSPDGKRLVSGSGDRTLKVWDLKTRKAELTLKGHKGAIRAVAFSPDGTVIASASEDRTVKLWDAATGSEKQTLSGHNGMVWCLAFSRRGKSLASAGLDNAIIVWDPATGRRRATLRGHSDVVTSLAFAPDMRGLISGSYDKSVRFWKAKAPPIPAVLTIAASPEDLRSVAFSSDGRFMAAAGHDTLARLWDLKTGRLTRVLRGHGGGIRTVAFSPNCKLLATGSWDNMIHVWDVATGRSIARLGTPEDKHNVASVAFAPDNRHIVSGGFDKTVRAWDIDSRKMLWKSVPHQLEVMGVDVSPDGRTVVSVTGFYKRKNDPGEITFFDLKTGKMMAQMPGPKDAKMVEYSPDGRQVLIGSGNANTPIWLIDVKTRQRTTGPPGFRATYLPDGKTIAVCRGPNRQVYLYDLAAKREIARFVGHPAATGTIYDIKASPDGSVVASMSTGGSLKLWPLRNVPALKSSLTIAAHKGASRFALELADGKRIVTGGHDKLVKVFDRATGKLLHTLKGHKSPVTSGALSPDGSMLVTASWNGMTRFWDMASMQPAGEIRHKRQIVALSFLKDGKTLVTAGRTKMLQLWDVKTRKLLRSSKPQEEPIGVIDVSPDEKLIAAVIWDWQAGNKSSKKSRSLKLFRVSDLSEVQALTGVPDEVKSVRFRPDGRRLVASGKSGIALYELPSGKLLDTIRPRYGVPCATFAGDGSIIASGGWTGEVALWNANTGQRIASGQGHEIVAGVKQANGVGAIGWGYGLRATRDGKQLLTAGRDGTVRVWSLPGQEGRSLADDIRRWNTPRALPQLASVSTQLLVQNSSDRAFFGVASPDFKRFAVGGNDGKVLLYKLPSFQVEQRFEGHAGRVWAGTFSHDGKTVATAGDDKTVRLWDVETGEVKVMKGHEKTVFSLVFTPDDKQVVSCDALGYIKIWDVESARCVETFRKKEAGLIKLAISPDGKLLAAAGWSKEIDLWSLPDRKLLGTLKGHKDRILSLAFSPDGRTLVSGDAQRNQANVIKVWDVATQTLRASLGVKTNHAVAAAFSPDGRTFVTSGGDVNLRFWDVATGQLLATVPSGHRLDVRSIEWSPDGTQLLTTSLSGTAKRWSLSAGGELWMRGYTTVAKSALRVSFHRTLVTHGAQARMAVFSPDGSLLATGGDDKVAKLWDAKTLKLRHTLAGHRGAVTFGEFSPDNRILATCSFDSTARLWDVASGKLLHVLKAHSAGLRKVAFSPDGRHVVTCSEDSTACIWETATGKCLTTIKTDKRAYSADVSPDGKTLAIGTGDWKSREDGSVTLYEFPSGRKIKELPRAKGAIWSVTFLPDGRRLAVANANAIGVSLWNAETGRMERALQYPRSVALLRVRPGSRWLTVAYGYREGSVAVWDLAADARLCKLQVTNGKVLSAETSRDGKMIAAATTDGVKIYRITEAGEASASASK